MAEKRKRGRPRSVESDGATKPSQFRLGPGTLAEIDWLADRFGLASRADVLRHLVRKAALAEGYEQAEK